ncbi:MAG: leucyl aminopeptidase, partial [Sphingomonas sp.]
MQIAFSSAATTAPAILALPIEKDLAGRASWAGLGDGHQALATAAARAARF